MNLPGGYHVDAPGGAPSGGTSTVVKIISVGLQSLFLLLVIYSLWMIFRAAWAWIYSEGDKSRIQAARERLIWAVGGLIVAFISFFIVNIVGHVFGVSLLQLP